MRFGRYQLLDKLAVGGMAEIFLAKSMGEAGFERTCVVKRVLPHLAESPDFVNMFLDEGRIAARIHHPGIVQIFDLGRQDDHYYLAMEYLAGEDLNTVLTRAEGHPLPPEVAAAIIARAAEALHFVHALKDARGQALGVVHRDVSPSNIMVTYQGLVKVLDFGVARSGGRLARVEGQQQGKAAYLAPEQLLGSAVDRRADVWSLGVCLFELLSGRPLFSPGQQDSLTAQALGAPLPSLRALRPEIPRELEHLVEQALTREVAARLESAEALQLGLEAFLTARTGSPSGPHLGRYLLKLFGAERAEAKQQLGLLDAAPREHLAGQPRPSGSGTEDLSASALTTRLPARRRAPWRGAALLVLAGVALGLALLREVRRPARRGPLPNAAPELTVPRAAVTALEPTPTPTPPVLAPPAERAPPAAVAVRRMRPGAVHIDSNLPVSVYEATKLLGVTPCELQLPPGKHTLRLVGRAEKVLKLARLTLHEGSTQSLSIHFAKGRLAVDAVPWADVFLDGARVGATPVQGIEVWDGLHALRLVAPQGEKALQVEVVAGATRSVHVAVP